MWIQTSNTTFPHLQSWLGKEKWITYLKKKIMKWVTPNIWINKFKTSRLTKIFTIFIIYHHQQPNGQSVIGELTSHSTIKWVLVMNHGGQGNNCSMKMKSISCPPPFISTIWTIFIQCPTISTSPFPP